MKIKVVLVHGTWGRKSPLAQREGYVSRELQRRLPENAIEVTAETWSGHNRHGPRRMAADELVRKLDTLAAGEDDQLLILAHSHGGNVALDALARSGRARSRSRLVCVATPFIHVRGRDVALPVLVISSLLAFGGVFGVVVLAMALMFVGGVDLDGIPEPVVVIGFWICFFVALRLWSRSVLRIDSWCERTAQAALMKVSHIQALELPILQVRCQRDEAAAGLSVAQVIIEIPYLLMSLAQSLLHQTIRHPKVALVPLFFLGLLATPVVAPQLGLPANSSAVGYLAVLALFVVVALATSLVWPAAVALTYIVRGLAFGIERWASSITIDITAESLPPCLGPVRRIIYNTRATLSRVRQLGAKVPWSSRRLAHSAIYYDPLVLDHIAAWIQGVEQLDATVGDCTIAEGFTVERFSNQAPTEAKSS